MRLQPGRPPSVVACSQACKGAWQRGEVTPRREQQRNIVRVGQGQSDTRHGGIEASKERLGGESEEHRPKRTPLDRASVRGEPRPATAGPRKKHNAARLRSLRVRCPWAAASRQWTCSGIRCSARVSPRLFGASCDSGRKTHSCTSWGSVTSAPGATDVRRRSFFGSLWHVRLTIDLSAAKRRRRRRLGRLALRSVNSTSTKPFSLSRSLKRSAVEDGVRSARFMSSCLFVSGWLFDLAAQ